MDFESYSELIQVNTTGILRYKSETGNTNDDSKGEGNGQGAEAEPDGFGLRRKSSKQHPHCEKKLEIHMMLCTFRSLWVCVL